MGILFERFKVFRLKVSEDFIWMKVFEEGRVKGLDHFYDFTKLLRLNEVLNFDHLTLVN